MTIPKQQRTKADLVYEALQSSIMSGNIREGEHLRQEEVAARLGVSQTPVREAFRRLESEGLVEHAPNRGIIVRGIPWSPPPSPLDVIARRWGELVNDPDRIPGATSRRRFTTERSSRTSRGPFPSFRRTNRLQSPRYGTQR